MAQAIVSMLPCDNDASRGCYMQKCKEDGWERTQQCRARKGDRLEMPLGVSNPLQPTLVNLEHCPSQAIMIS